MLIRDDIKLTYHVWEFINNPGHPEPKSSFHQYNEAHIHDSHYNFVRIPKMTKNFYTSYNWDFQD